MIKKFMLRDNEYQAFCDKCKRIYCGGGYTSLALDEIFYYLDNNHWININGRLLCTQCQKKNKEK